ncbi:LpqB family beta-propeller domain-containing protein [Actinophytocola gossypii]|uniref:GerMN domain-containing protein n=1 Tax=Actinophytocola gossypii TaxID=2812003 RepID=A0ABT2JEF3_9PSEU|nr:LpqB family beta-propeller domain-containing protein [Actinophytocola gossypii]MCT2586258.1 GerMN domain-containing protein [Actinophytocola gossypii]
MTRSRALLMVLSVLLVAGCSYIPDSSSPHAVRDDGQQPQPTIAEPDPGLDAYDLVREFIHKSGNPEAAAMYLTEDAKRTWDADAAPKIISDTFATVPNRKPSVGDTGTPEDGVKTVTLQVTLIGRLGSDHAFVPEIEDERYNVLVEQQPNGTWRISHPPKTRFVPLSDFETSYRSVTVYYFDPDLRVTVPDIRYVAAEPVRGLPSRVINVLLSGPSDTMRRSVVSPLEGVKPRTNVVPDDSGILPVDLTSVGDKSLEQRKQMAAQIVLSLQAVTSNRLRIMVDGADLVPGHRDWRLRDLPAYDAPTKPDSDLSGLVVADGVVRSLRNGSPIEGPAGNGSYLVLSAAQSVDGEHLAAVVSTAAGPLLRVGEFGGFLEEVTGLEAATMTRPTWLVSTSKEVDPTEVWTVADGEVVRVVRTSEEGWKAIQVSSSELVTFGAITDLRLSRDGTRAAIVAGGRVVVASVVRDDKGSASLRYPRQLQPTYVQTAVGVDWVNQETLVVGTQDRALPVLGMSVDGMKVEIFDRNNLQPPISAIAAAPDRDVLVTDSGAMSSAPGADQLWRQHPHGQGPDSIPFYPG